MSNYLGIDIGGTNIGYGIVNADGEFVYENSVQTASKKTAQELADFIFDDVKKKGDFIGIGIGAPSVNQNTQCIEYAPNMNWGDVVDLNGIFAKKFNRTVFVINDANAAALGEKFYGEAKEMTNFAVITLGTGVGMGMYINDQLVLGKNGLAGEIGHSIIQRDGRECKCGNHGCLETYVAKDGIVSTAKEKLEFSSISSVLNLIQSSDLTPTEIFKAARKEDPVALEVVDSVGKDLAFSISNLMNILDLECVFLAGGISNNGNLLKRKIEKHLKGYLLPNLHDKSQIRISILNQQNSGILGAVAAINSQLKLALT
jgi:glucokinase